MGALSNFLRRTGSPRPGSEPPSCRLAKPPDYSAALRFVLGTDDESHIVDFLRFAVQRNIDLSGMWIAEQDGKMAWAILPVTSPGRTVLLLTPPTPLNAARERAGGALLEAVCKHQAEQGQHLAQVLIDPDQRDTRKLLEVHEFVTIAELHYLQLTLRRPTITPVLPDGLWWTPYSPLTHERFARTISATYEQSMDCPKLNGLRAIEDVIVGHKSSGEFDPRNWLLLSEPLPDGSKHDVAVLLANKLEKTESMELVYLGIIPAARRRGFGTLLMKQLLAMVSEAKLKRISLAVDAQNVPALKLYYRHGMEQVGQRIALMRSLALEMQRRDAEKAAEIAEKKA